jgi:hypothetical protein
MKKNILKLFTIFLILVFTSTNILFAQQLLEGENYNIVVPNLSSGGDQLINEGGDYEVFSTLGNAFYDPRLYSDSYSITHGEFDFEPNIPEVDCFETITDGTSDCSTGPTYLNEHGMVRVCGPSGCYDRARFEIDPQENPDDTLYGIQISTDNFEEDIKYLDGTTFLLKDERAIEDYKTKTDWETPTFNILGLQSETEYQLRITALFGDLSESVPGQSAQATTALPTMSFRIGLGYEDGENINYNPPYEILFDEAFQITRGANVISSDRLIWSLTNTNANSGITIVQRGEHGGLYNSEAGAEGYTIDSLSGDLTIENEGIGLKNYQVSSLYNDTDGALSSLTPEAIYDSVEEDTVGIIDTVFKKVYESTGPIHTGEAGLKIKTKASLSTPEGNYFEDITFVLIAKY